MANTARDLIKCRISNTPGTSGNFTLSTAFTNSLLPASGDNGLAFKLNITENGVGTEIRRNCTYTYSTTTFSRGTMVRSTGTADAALDFTSAAIVSVVPSAEDFTPVNGVYVEPRNSSADPANVQAAADAAMAAGVSLILGVGTYDFTTGGIVCGSGPDIYDGDAIRSGMEYRALKIIGAGIGLTKILVGAGVKGIHYVDDAGVGKFGVISNLTLRGSGINDDGVGLQLGGLSTTGSDLLENFVVEDVEFDNLTSCMIADDVTCLDVIRPRMGRFKYGFEWGYNVDDVRVTQALFGYNDALLNNVTCTITSGSNAITLPAGVTARLQVGYAISTGSQKCFTRETYVGSISGNDITLVNYNGVAKNAIANGTSASFFCGRVFNFGASSAGTDGTLYASIGSQFVSPYWNIASSGAYAAQRGRISATNHTYEGAAGSIERLMDIGHSSHSCITSRVYVERVCEGYEISDPGVTGASPGPITIENSYWGFKTSLVAPFINIVCDDFDCYLIVRGNFSDSASDNEPWIECAGYAANGGQIAWEDNKISGTRTAKFLSASDTFASQPVVPTGGAMYVGSARKGDAIQTWINAAWFYAGQDILKIDLSTGAKTVSNPAGQLYGSQNHGKEFTLLLLAGTGNALTLGNTFIGTNGSALGTIAAGTTGQTMTLAFTYDAINYKFLAKATPQWV